MADHLVDAGTHAATDTHGRYRNMVASLVAAVSTAVAAILAFWRLDVSEVWIDESIYTNAAWEYLHGDLTANPEHPPLGKLIIGAWQVSFGEGIISARALMGVVMIATAAAIWWFSSRIVGPRWAVVPAILWMLMQRSFEDRDRLDRLASLDMLMVLFLVLGFALAWRWWESKSAWIALLAGLTLGAAVMTKVPAAVFIPALFVLVVGRWHWKPLFLGIIALAGGAAAVVLATLAPFGYWDAITRMVEFQTAHNADGHSILIDDRIYEFAPWWSTFRFALDGLGIWGVIALVLGSITAIVAVRPRRVVGMLIVAGVLAAMFFVVISKVVLPHYFLDWVWIPTILSGLALPALLRRTALLPVGAVIVIAASFSVAANTQQVLGVRSRGLVAAAEIIGDVGALDRPVLVQGIAPSLAIGEHIPVAVGEPTWPGLGAAVIGTDPRQPVAPEVAELVTNPPAGVRVHTIDDVSIITFDGTLSLQDGVFTVTP